MMKLLNKMINVVAPSGNTEAITSLLKDEVGSFFDNVYFDDLGSLILHRKNRGRRIMIAASADRSGILVTHVNRFGAVFFEKIGRIADDSLYGSTIKFESGARGIVCENKNLSTATGDKKRKLFIDLIIGRVNVGDVGVLEPGFTFGESSVFGRCLGDIVGAYALAEAVKSADGFGNNELYVVFAEFGALHNRGLKAAGFRINPEIAFCVGDCPTVARSIENEYSCSTAAEFGGGVAIKFKDRSVVTNKAVRDRLASLAAENNIDYQFSFTDDEDSMPGVLELSGSGVACGEICVPVKHSGICADTVSVLDLNHCIRLLALLLKARF